MSSAKETHLMPNTLAYVVRMCLGKVTTVELRNEAHVTGRVIDVDGYMNVTMKQAELVDPSRKTRTKLDVFFVQNRLIRAAQIPAEIDIKKE